MKEPSFDLEWRTYLNGPSGPGTLSQQEELLLRCLKAATSVAELVQVFNAASDTLGMSGVRSPALKRMIPLVATKAEAERVYALASKRGSMGLVFRTVEPLARAKLATFTTS